MSKKPSSSQRRKHEKIEDEFLRSRLSLAVIEKAGSIKLEAYQILQETLVMLRNRRMEAGLTLEAVAKTSGTDKAYLSRLENGKVRNPTFGTLYRYAAAIGPIRSMKDLAGA